MQIDFIDNPCEYPIPSYMLERMQEWANQTNVNAPGDFLWAIITNNLRDAVQRADNYNIHLIPAYVSWFYNEAPSACWGSVEKATAWQTRATTNVYEFNLKEKKHET